MDPGFDRQHGRPCSSTEPSYGPETFNLAHGWYVLDDCRDEHVMHRLHRYGKTAIDDARRASGRARVVGLAVAIALAAAVGLSIMPTARSARPNPPPIAAAPPPAAVDPSRFILNALLAPALDADAVPLLWVDPRPTLGCGPNATVRVNGEPLLAGALVPVAPFELEWQTDDCRPLRCARAAVRRTGPADGVQRGLGVQRDGRALGPACGICRERDRRHPSWRGVDAAMRRVRRDLRAHDRRGPLTRVSLTVPMLKNRMPKGVK